MYNHKEIETKWQKFWEENNIFKTENDFSKPKYYTLDMFPYPSGAGLHVGHPEGFTANDIIARYKHANGFNVLHPMGWDAFGLPAENYAIKTGTHPRSTTDKNIKVFKTQLKKLGFSYDWDREVDTTDPDYYKWTQWIFLKLFEKGLAYEQDLPINYCPSCKTGLANEEVLNNFTCERCNEKVEKKKIRQWVLAITKYADRLLKDVDNLDWPESIKDMQRNWIGKSEGCEFQMKKSDNENLKISVYTTRIDTVFGMTYAVLAPDHKDVEKFITEEQKEVCEKYIEKANKMSDQDRTADNKEKTGVFTGSYVVNPFNNEKVPLWIGDYVLGNYGTGAVMAVPAHDERDFEFAKKYGLEIKQSVAPYKVMSGLSKPRSTKIDRKFNCVTSIIKHSEDDLYLLLKFKKSGEYGLVGGSLEEGENHIEAIKREIDEETGFKNIEILEELFENSYSRGYKARKDLEEEANDKVFVCKLKDLEKNSNDDKCDEHDGFCWVNKQDFLEKIDLSHHKFFFEHYSKENRAFSEYGVLVNSGEFSGLKSEEALKKLTEFATKNGFGKKKINYKLRDWLFSRQRYWGEPIPLIHLEEKEIKKLPLLTKEDLSEFENEIEKIITKKMKAAPLQAEWDVRNDNSAKLSSENSLSETEKNANKKMRNDSPQLITGSLVHNDRVSNSSSENSIIENEKKTNKKMRNAPLRRESGTPMGTSAGISLLDIISKNIKKVKKKRQKSFKLKFFVDTILNGEKEIRVSGRYLKSHFEGKSGFERNKRLEFAQTIIENLEKVYFINDIFGIIIINGRYFIVILEHYKDNIYDLVTFYNFNKLTNIFLKKVYNLDNKHLLINGEKVKIYDGIYSKIICDYNLPLKLPEVKNYEPSGDGNSPLAKVNDFVNVKVAPNLNGKRETNTMPQWGGSCWYYLRYMDPKNSEKLVDPQVEKYWGQVDSYVGGAEHAVLHLLYARFWHKFLFDIGVVSTNEPFYKLRNQGLILAHAFKKRNGGLIANDLVEEKNGKYYEISSSEEVDRIISKMSKSLKNVINPDDIVEEYGADSLRLYEMYMAEFKDTAPWDTKGIIGVRRFLEKAERLFGAEAKISSENDDFTIKLLHKTIKKVEEDIENYKFNTAIAALMILVNNGLPKSEENQKIWKETFVKLLHPFAPHLAEELWERQTSPQPSPQGEGVSQKGYKSIFFEVWPKYDENLVKDDEITIGVQVMGKLRGEIKIGIKEDEKSVLEKAKSEESVKKWIDGKTLVKEIYVKGKIVNLVVK